MNQPLIRCARRLSALAAGLALLALPLAGNAESIVTGGKTGTYYAIGNNLRDIVQPSLEVKDSRGSWANVEEMSRTKGVTLAIVQSDVYGAFVMMRDDASLPAETRREYAQLLAPLRVFMPLYREEVHFLVRQDEPIEFIHQIKGKRIWMDMEKSGTYLTALNLYGKMFQERPQIVEPFINPTATGEDEGTRRRRSALMALGDPEFYRDYPKIDVMVLVGGQPLGLLEKNVPPNLKLLKFDSGHPAASRLLQDYTAAEVRKDSYPALKIAGNGVPTLAVGSYLVTANFIDPKRNEFIKDFADRFCSQFDALKDKGHPKWRALTWQPGSSLPPLAAGWEYSGHVRDRLGSCRAGAGQAGGTAPAAGACSPQMRAAGLCR